MTRRHVPPSRTIVRLCREVRRLRQSQIRDSKGCQEGAAPVPRRGHECLSVPSKPRLLSSWAPPPAVVHGLIGRDQIGAVGAVS